MKKLFKKTLILSLLLSSLGAHAQSFGGYSLDDAKKVLGDAKTALEEANKKRIENEKKRAQEEKKKSVSVENPIVSNSLFSVSGVLDADVRFIMVSIEKDSFVDRATYEVKNGQYKINLSLKDGMGLYSIKLFQNKTEDRYQSYYHLSSIQVDNRDERDMAYLLPSYMVESDNEQIINLVKNLTEGSTSDEEAILKIHNYVAKNIKYNWDGFKDNSYLTTPFNAVYVLNKKMAVCAGYSNLLAAMARAYGIPAKVINGKADGVGGWGDHAWNEVLINGEWKIIDSTWNAERKDNKYFFIDAKALEKDHKREKEIPLY